MGTMQVKQGISESVLEATIIRADGTVEPLGVVSYYSKNPFKMLMWKLKKMLGLNK